MDQYLGKFLDNRYELLEVIGTGGMAVVYKARCHRLNRLVAVKVLKSDLAQDAEFRRRFHDESQAVAMLSHPNIVAVYDVSRSSDLDYIVMELIDGITLKQYMRKKGTLLNWREALHFITQIIRALSHAHSRGIIHRDIKPHNIMVLRDGSVKVADFGIARLVSTAQSTLTQEALGSVHYISPEQARGSHIDARADIYSAGVVLYEMTTGRLPFEGDSAVSVAIQHINSIPLSPRELNEEIPEALETIILKAMAPNMDQRYSGADAMLVDLEEFRKNPNINFDYNRADLALEPDMSERTQRVRSGGTAAAVAPKHNPAGQGRPERDQGDRRRVRRDEEDDRYDDGRGGVWPLLLAIGAILVFIIGIGYFLWSTFFSDLMPQAVNYKVPPVIGLTVVQAEALPEVRGLFTIEIGSVVESNEFPAGTIVDQSPKADAVVRTGSLIITVDVSGGQDEQRMPPVLNLEQRHAVELLEDEFGLVVVLETANSATITRGYVCQVSIPEGATIDPGQEVILTISQGPAIKKVTLPSFTGFTLERVREQFRTLGLTVGTIEEVPNHQYVAGVVVDQSIPLGTEVDAGTEIDLKVSNGEREENPPPVTSEGVPEQGGEGEGTSPPETSDPLPSPSQGGTTKPMTDKTVKVTLPDKDGIVLVVITVDGVERWRNPVDCSVGSTISPRISGSGIQEVCIYLDGVLDKQFDLDFNS